MKAWELFLATLEDTLGVEAVKKWLHPLSITNFDAGNLYLEAENTFQVDWFEEHVRLHASLLVNNNHRPIKIHLTAREISNQKKAPKETPPPLEFSSSTLNLSETLFSFVGNPFAVDFLQTMTPGTYNPIYLYGASGTGKTHLLNGIALHLETQGLKVFFVHAQNFTEHVVAAIRGSQMREFRQTYRNQDVLIIDDIDYLARKNATQEELFHTFNALHSTGRQIIVSSHLPTQRLSDIEPRLVSRFEWGILLKLEAPTPAELRQVLMQRARTVNFTLHDQVVEFILNHFSSSAKSAMRALEALCLRTSGCQSAEHAQKLLADLMAKENESALSIKKILQEVASYFDVQTTEIMGKSQSKEFSGPRQVAMYLCRHLMKMPYKRVGAAFHRDHSTVMTSIRQIEKKQKEDGETALAIQTIQSRLSSALFKS
jgi:chromosomal replication initiator protein